MKSVWLIFFSVSLWGQNCIPPERLTLNGVQSGELTASSCQLFDSSKVAAYRAVFPVRGSLQLAPKGTGFTPSIILRDADGRKVASGVSIQQYVEAGTYTVLVNSAAAGKFTLTSVFTPEPNVLCTTFERLGTDRKFAGTLAAASCKLPDGSLFDGWQTTIYGAGTLTVTMQSSAFHPFLIVRNESGNVLANDENEGNADTARISVQVSGRETYAVVAAAADSLSKGGTYQISTAFSPDGEETCRPVTTLTEAIQLNGSVSAASCNFNLPGRQDSSLFNVYSLRLPVDGVVQISVPSATFTPLLLLLDANGNSIVEDSESGGAYTPLIRQSLRAGDYSLIVFNEDSFDGDYSLQYNFAREIAQPCAVQDAAAGQPATGTLIGDASCRVGELLSDTYRLVLTSSAAIDMDLSSADFSTFLGLRDAKDNLLMYGDRTAEGASAHLQTTLPAGSYFVSAASVDLPGAYSLNVQVTPRNIPPCAKVQNLPVNTGFVNRLGTDGCTGNAGEPVDYYKFTTTAEGTVALVMTSGDIDGILTLTDSAGKTLRTDDNSYSLGDAIIVHLLKAGTYKVEARGRSLTGSNRYRVDLLWTSTAKPLFCSASNLNIGASKNAILTYTACQYYDNTFADIYSFQVNDSEKPVTISANSDKFDAYLLVTDSKGNFVASDDNSGGGSSALLTALLDPGVYYLVVKPADDPAQSGPYRVTVSQ